MKHNEEKADDPNSEIEDEKLDDENSDDDDEDSGDDDDLDDDDYDIERYGNAVIPQYDAGRYDSARGWQPPDKYKKQRDDYRKKHPTEHFQGSIFARESLNDVFTSGADGDPTKRLFGDLVRTGELTILFADTGVGKSILAVQIGNAVARGIPVLVENGELRIENSTESGKRKVGNSSDNSPLSILNSQLPKNEARPQSVLYIDFEMTRAQVAERYSARVKNGKYVHRYRFRNMERLYIDWDDDLPEGFKSVTEFIGHSLWKEVGKKNIRLLIIDNISYLTSGQGAKEALALMKALKALKEEYRLAILVLAHTPKRSLAKHLSINDLAGRKELSNFIDNSFAIGRSHLGPDMRYIKQMKQRNRPETFGEDSVIVCRLEKPHNFPRFSFVEFSPERPHLLRPYDDPSFDRQTLIAEAQKLAAAGHSERDIANRLQISNTTAHRYLQADGS